MRQVSEELWAQIQEEREQLARLTAPALSSDQTCRMAELLAKYRAQNDHLMIMEMHELMKLLLAERAARQ